MSKTTLRTLLGILMFAGILLALWPLGQTVYANWNQQQLRAQWQQETERNKEVQKSEEPSARAAETKSISAVAVEKWPSTRILIPEANLDAVVVEGWDESILKKAPGHLPGSALPGQRGNCAIAGHRNVYGSPFYKVDSLQPGALIELRTPEASFQYRVIEVIAVADADTTVLRPPSNPDATPLLTLVTCTIPRTSNRIVVSASLEGSSETSM